VNIKDSQYDFDKKLKWNPAYIAPPELDQRQRPALLVFTLGMKLSMWKAEKTTSIFIFAMRLCAKLEL